MTTMSFQGTIEYDTDTSRMRVIVFKAAFVSISGILRLMEA